jgi:cell division septum initiation protein DivIVA
VAGIDILYLLDRLEEVLASGSRLPFSSRTMIDEQECLDILDQIRVALPEEIKQARQVNAEHDSIVSEAEAHAQQIIREAEERAAEKVEEHTLVLQARQRAEQVETEAEARQAEIQHDADEYVYQTLAELESTLERLLVTVRQGSRVLKPVNGARPARRGGLG